MIPICENKFIPADPCEEGNPVFSILQTDAIVYGSDLAVFIRNELTDYQPCRVAPKEIPFWSKLSGDTPVMSGYEEEEELSESSSDPDSAAAKLSGGLMLGLGMSGNSKLEPPN